MSDPAPTLEDRNRAVKEAERISHAYAASLDVGPEREAAFAVFERLRQALRRFPIL
jgi:hypothetical protein